MQGRSAEISRILGGDAHCAYFPRLVRRPLVPLRYVASALTTLRHLRRCRPGAVVVTNPPMPAALLVTLYAKAARIPVILDSHPAGFGAQHERVSAHLQFLHRPLARRAAFSLVTDDHWCDVLAGWGARGMVFHEAPPAWAPLPPPARPVGRRVLFAGSFGGDEPIPEVFRAAALCPEMTVVVTGDVRRCPPELRASAPPNVVLTGFLGPDRYREELAAADVVITLSTDPTSVMRAAYEAVWARRPLVLTDRPALRALFPAAVPVQNVAEAIAAGLRQAFGSYDHLVAACDTALDLQNARVATQVASLRRALAGAADAALPSGRAA